ncbi:MAG: ankyrin repeat domain-containing protein, partial [Gammaproteobacteria bacterium]|nr:ankyrin repeat domain-containing protein [Gammaproteobacteria bacterium]
LHIACLLGCFEIVQLLLTNGANPTSVDNRGKTPLDYCQAGNQAIVNCLKEIDIDDQRAENAQSNYLSASNYRQFIILPSQNFAELQIPASKSSKAMVDNAIKELKKTQSPAKKSEVRQILARQSPPHVIDAICSQTFSYLQAQFSQLSGRTVLEACLAGRKACRELILSSSPSSLMPVHKNTHDILSEAINNKDEITITQFLQNNPGLNIDSATLNKKNKRTALHRAACEGNLGLLNLLIKLGANINIADKQGDNALHIAIKNARFPTALYLLTQGADAQLVNKTKKRPVDILLACAAIKNIEDKEDYEQLKQKLLSPDLTRTEISPASLTIQEESINFTPIDETSLLNISPKEGVYNFCAILSDIENIDKSRDFLPDITNSLFTQRSNIPSAFFSTVTPRGIINSLTFDMVVKKITHADANFSVKINLDKLQKKTQQHYDEIMPLVQAILREKGINSSYYKQHKNISEQKRGYIYEVSFIEEDAASRLLKALHKCLVNESPLHKGTAINEQLQIQKQ